jgi:hypothetical protein
VLIPEPIRIIAPFWFLIRQDEFFTLPDFSLKKLELLRSIGFFRLFWSPEKFHHTKLFIGERKHDDFAFGWQGEFYPFDVDLGIFATVTMPDVNGILHHGKPVFLEFLPEQGNVLPVLLGLRWQIVKDKYPHNPILV